MAQLMVRWKDGAAGHVPLLQTLRPDVVVSETAVPEFEKAGLKVVPGAALGRVVTDGLWPGIRRGPSRRGREVEVASASSEPWVDANGYLVAYHRALDSKTPVLLAYEANEKAGVRPDVEIPYGTSELALIEARVGGGNFVVDLPVRYRQGLIAGEAKATEAWKALARTAAWLKQNETVFGRPALPQVMAMVEPGGATREIANLLHRRGASPLLYSTLPSNAKPLALVVAGLKQIPSECFKVAEEGGIVVTDQKALPSTTMVREEADRVFCRLGKGTVVAYRRPIVDPSEFAMDVIDLITHRRRATRLWNALSAIPLATEGERPGEALLHVVNYGSPAREEIQAHIQGHFSKATLLSPEKAPVVLKTVRRGPSTEVFLPTLERVAVVRFSN
ncbi:MAG: hypothetical protein NTW74_26760 [Acidobacteria bacterium]|nr:hypothetical protein [Acidobacteriota bacterium]